MGTLGMLTTTTWLTQTPRPMEQIAEVDIAIFILLISCSVFGTIGNSLALKYFLTKKRDVPTTIYICVAITDIAISLMIFPVAVPYLSQKTYQDPGPWLFASPTVCSTWGPLWYTFTATSIFLVALLSITRTLSLVRPFQSLRQGLVVSSMGLYVLVLGVQSTIPFWVGEGYQYRMGFCSWSTRDIPGSLGQSVYTAIYFTEYYFPVFPVIISCGMTISSLKASVNRAINSANRSVTITIVLFTTIYLVCSIPPVVMYTLTLLRQHGVLRLNLAWDAPNHYFHKLYYTNLVALNSGLNPLLYFCRMSKMRGYLVGMVRGLVTGQGFIPHSPLLTSTTTRDYSVTAALTHMFRFYCCLPTTHRSVADKFLGLLDCLLDCLVYKYNNKNCRSI